MSEQHCMNCAHKDLSRDHELCKRCGTPARNWTPVQMIAVNTTSTSDGSTASYYELPDGCSELQHLISHRNMNAQIGEIFRACYRMGLVSHSSTLRDAKKILFYAKAEVERLEKAQSV